MIKLENFGLAFGERVLVDNINQTYQSGELIALIGRNGSGKSTMLRAMAGINKKYRGQITYGNKTLNSLGAVDISRTLAIVTTERPFISRFTCRDLVSMGRMPYTDWMGRLGHKDIEAVEAALEQVGMSMYAERQIDSLSDGEAQRIMIAKAIAQDTPVILLDEPTSFLDIPNRYSLVRLLAALAHENGKCVIYSTHELDIALKLSDRISLIDSPYLLTAKPDKISPEIHRFFSIS